MDTSELSLSASFCSPPSEKLIPTNNVCKSEVNVVLNHAHRDRVTRSKLNEYFCDYHQKNEYEVAVNESRLNQLSSVVHDHSLTNSELDRLEVKIFEKISQDLPADNASSESIDCPIKLFKIKVQEIFNTFYTSMEDFEVYKKRFYEILEKKDIDVVIDMEDFIKDMIQHILSTENSSIRGSKNSCLMKADDYTSSGSVNEYNTIVNRTSDGDKSDGSEMNVDGSVMNIADKCDGSVMNIGDKSDGYVTFTSTEYAKYRLEPDSISGGDKKTYNKELFNSYLLTCHPYVQHMMKDRNLLSEMNINEPFHGIGDGKYVASVKNLWELAEKRAKLEQNNDHDTKQTIEDTDHEIPLKVSYAKKDIYLDEDFSHERGNEKSFIARFCSYLCKMFRKSQ